MPKRILVFEFITGGGFSQQMLPLSLANEGMLMLNALLQDLAGLSSIQLTVLQDWRCQQIGFPENAHSILVNQNQSIDALLAEIIDNVDAVWLIAPETNHVLKNISVLVEEKSKILLNSSSQAVALCSDKLSTIQHLQQYDIAVIDTIPLDLFSAEFDKPWVIKSKDGVGCENNYYISTEAGFKQLFTQLKSISNYIVQPYIQAESLSLSCLFKAGKAWLLCCNRQHISVKQGKFQLLSCEVNISHTRQSLYQALIDKIAKAIPGLWGYVGIDLIEKQSGELWVLEINPRLTTSYVGIQQAVGINVAKLVIELLDQSPVIKKTSNQQVTVSVV